MNYMPEKSHPSPARAAGHDRTHAHPNDCCGRDLHPARCCMGPGPGEAMMQAVIQAVAGKKGPDPPSDSEGGREKGHFCPDAKKRYFR